MDGLTNVGLIVHVNYFLLEMECVSFSPNVFSLRRIPVRWTRI